MKTNTLTPPDKKAHFMDMKTNPIDKESIVQTLQVAHVTFYLVKDKLDEDRFFVYSASEDRGVEAVRDEHTLYEGQSIPYNNALTVLKSAVQHLEEILERKRKGIPTPKQLHFLFREKIPIPLTLTWGEASDLIDERLAQKEYEKEVRQRELLAKFNGFAVGMTVYQPYVHSGKVYIATGKITKLTSGKMYDVKYAYVQWETKEHRTSHTCRLTIDEIYKTLEEAKAIPQFKNGDRVQHSMFGPGTVLSVSISQGKELVCIRFDKPVLESGRTESSFYTGSLQKLREKQEGADSGENGR